MGRYLAIAIAVLALIAGGGYALRDCWFGSPPTPPVVAARTPPAPARPTEAARVAAPPVIDLVEVEGRVEKHVGDRWVPLVAHDPLTAQDTIRTSDGARARIQSGDTTVELGDRSEITVGEISTQLSEYLLGEGRVSAQAGGAGTTIRILTRGTDAVAEAGAGRFDVLEADPGHVAVASEQGTVTVTARGRAVDVHPGEQTVVLAGSAPSAPAKVPPSLFLKVGAMTTHGHVAALHGETAPGALVMIGGARIAPDAQGTFAADVPLNDGENVIVVLVEDAMGRTQRKVVKHVVDAKGPEVNAKVEWR